MALTFKTCITDSTTIDLRGATYSDGGYLDETSDHIEFLNTREMLICSGLHEFSDDDMVKLAQTGTDPYTNKEVFNLSARITYWEKNGGFLGIDNNYNTSMKDKIIISNTEIYCKNFYEADKYVPVVSEWGYVTDTTKLNKLRAFIPRLSYDSTNGVVKITNISELLNNGFNSYELAAFLVHKRTRVPRGISTQSDSDSNPLSRGTKNSALQEIFKNVYNNKASHADDTDDGSITRKSFGIIENALKRSADGTTGYIISDDGTVGKNNSSGVNDFYKSLTTDVYERYYKNSKSGYIDRYQIREDNARFLHIPLQAYGLVIGLRQYKKRKVYDLRGGSGLIISSEPLHETKFRDCEDRKSVV